MKRIFSTNVSENALSFALFVLRVGAGLLLMIKHGFDKLTHFSQMASKFADPFHIGTTTSLALVVFAEFFCAAFVVLGLFTRLACIPIIILFCVIIFKVTGADYFGKSELPTAYIIPFIALLFTGAGKFSVDHMISK